LFGRITGMRRSIHQYDSAARTIKPQVKFLNVQSGNRPADDHLPGSGPAREDHIRDNVIRSLGGHFRPAWPFSRQS
jgi:hypothetical protein